MAPKGSSAGLEMIAVAIDGRVCTTYAGLAGTFAGFADCCIRRKTLPGFHEGGLIAEAGLKGRRVELVLAGNRPTAELLEMMETALHNMMAFPDAREEAECWIDVSSGK